jgi:Tol biopolymer transport system component/tRNA A-37 threonylcarbamoyl transferase component Bud32
MIGRTLAHYEVTAKIGEGGMGEVYRARDTKLDRDVALKILPRELSGDRERSARFEREARTLASLQHANIASIYGYENIDGVRFLAMELVEGEDLAERLERGALSMDEALGFALQIAVGLEAAHERNIVHRDLKPANVKVGADGIVKILDFGLARAYTGDPDDGSDPALSPTITAAMTQAGTILGTAAYMSPEQARGRAVDKRSDIWAFGVMVYEMLTGSRLYDGETTTDILGAIVLSRPDIELLPKKVPARVKAMLARCLTPELPDRLRDIGEARIVLSNPGAPAATEGTQPIPAGSNRLWMMACVVTTVLAAALGFAWWTADAPTATVIQASINVPEDHAIVATGLRGGSLRVSPDGESIVFVAQQAGRQQIWIRALSEREGHPVQGTDGGHRPFWSPDSRSIGFFVDGNLRRVSVSGGAPLTIAPASNGRGGVWLENGQIVFAPGPNSALFAVSAGGGQPRAVTEPGPRSHREPRWLPVDGHFLYLDNVGGGEWLMCIGNTDGAPQIELGRSNGGVEYASGRILYLQGRTLVAHPLDLGSKQLTGEPSPLAERVIRDPNFGIGVFSVAQNGILCYQAGTTSGGQLVWMDREGNEIGVQGERAEYDEVALSDDGSTIATIINDSDGKSDVWLIDVERDTQRRFTFTADDAALRRAEVKWSGDGEFLVYSVETDSNTTIGMKRTDGGSPEEMLLEAEGWNIWPYDVSADSEWVLFGLQNESGNEDLWIVPTSGEGDQRPLFETPFDEWPGSISPDQRWLAVDSDETGRREIYVIPFPDGGGRWQVSRDGGRFPRWNGAGDELYYIDMDGALMAVSVEPAGGVFRATEPEVLFRANLYAGSFGVYDVHPSGERFLILEQSAQYAPISLFANWEGALEGR